MSHDDIRPGRRYLEHVSQLIERVRDEQWDAIAAAAQLVADALAAGRGIHAFGSGHSHMLAEEMFYRAGGLVDVRPILFEGLMLHADAPLEHESRAPSRPRARSSSTTTASRRGDVLLVFSNSGRNPVTIELAEAARSRGITRDRDHEQAPLRVDRTPRRRAPPLRGRRRRDRQSRRAGGCRDPSAGLRPCASRRPRPPSARRSSTPSSPRRSRSTSTRGVSAAGLREQQHRRGRRDQRAAAGAARMTGQQYGIGKTGAPAFAERGIVEGFYGRPWTHEQRLDMIRFIGERGMNRFVYAPKDDPLMRREWARRTAPTSSRDLASSPTRASSTASSSSTASRRASASAIRVTPTPMRSSPSSPPSRLSESVASVCSSTTSPPGCSTRPTSRSSTAWPQAQCALANRVFAAPAAQRPGREPHRVPDRVLGLWRRAVHRRARRRAASARSTCSGRGARSAPRPSTSRTPRRSRAPRVDHPLYWDNYPVNDVAMGHELHVGPYRGRVAAARHRVARRDRQRHGALRVVEDRLRHDRRLPLVAAGLRPRGELGCRAPRRRRSGGCRRLPRLRRQRPLVVPQRSATRRWWRVPSRTTTSRILIGDPVRAAGAVVPLAARLRSSAEHLLSGRCRERRARSPRHGRGWNPSPSARALWRPSAT